MLLRLPPRNFGLWAGVTVLMAAICAWAGESVRGAANANSPATLRLDVSDDGKQIKLLVRHPEIGLVCELHCYEGGPFGYGKYVKREDDSVVLVHTAGKMTGTTTFTPVGKDRVSMDVLIEGPNEELKQILYLGPCMQLWHSDAFKRRESLAEFAQRCFIYTMRGPVGMMDTARGLMKGFKPASPENSPACTQWYVPFTRAHPGDIWAFGASGDRTTYSLVGAASRDGKWLTAIGCASSLSIGQGWHDCIHHVPQVQAYLQASADRVSIRNMLYVTPNDKGRLLKNFQKDFPDRPDRPQILVTPSGDGNLSIALRSSELSPIDLALDFPHLDWYDDARGKPKWKSTSWGGFVRTGPGWRMWAYPHGDTVELCVSMEDLATSAQVQPALVGQEWTSEIARDGVPALVRRSPDRKWIAAVMWENPATEHQIPDMRLGVVAPGEAKGASVSARGKLILHEGDIGTLRERITRASAEWKSSFPYHMPVNEPEGPSRKSDIRFVAGSVAEVDEDGRPMTYGLTIVPPWKDGGSLMANFPEHFEHGTQGFGILRYSDRRAYAWKVAEDGRSANYEVESPELPGVTVRASATAIGDRARLKLKITNNGARTLERVKPLFCMWYGKLAGFPGRLTDNFDHTYVVMDGKPTALSSIVTSNPKATAKVAYVRGCNQHDCDQFANGRGGLIDRDIDRSLIAVASRDRKRNIAFAFTPGKSILSNAHIPCAHADPYFGTLKPGESREVEGYIVFTEGPLEATLRKLLATGVGASKEVTP